jgi:hypothetical protein
VTAGAAPGRARQGLRVLDEALKLLDALQTEQPTAASTTEQPGRHQGGECRLCPVCRGLAALREADPQALTRLGRALADLAAAFGEFAGGVGEDPEPAPATEPAGPRRVHVQHIDVSD